MQKVFLIPVAFNVMFAGEIVNIAKGELTTEDEALIKVLNGSKGAHLVDGEVVETGGANTDTGDNTELLQLQAEYLSKLGKKPHHKFSVEKLKALIADFDKEDK